MKRLMISLLAMAVLSGCAQQTEESSTPEPVAVSDFLPEKPVPESALAKDSPLNATNIDDYLFLKDVQYVDLRSFDQIRSEGAIAGFSTLPFYEVLVWWEPAENVLFTMSKQPGDQDLILGDPGTFQANYEESELILQELFQPDKPIVFMSTAGVEAAYMINLLIQYGYDPALLYNAGTFTNGMGNVVAYRDYAGHRHYIPGTDAYSIQTVFDWGELTPAE